MKYTVLHQEKNYPTIRIIYNHIDAIWSTDLADMIDCKKPNNKGFRYIFIIIDNFSKYTWCIPIKIETTT